MPLNALRAFEAAGRRLSVKDAADELHVTPGAVSQHIQRLESALGEMLFQRRSGGIALTPMGQDYLLSISAAFRQIADATQRIQRPRGRVVLTISTTALFAMKWLLPRLDRFTAAHPEIGVRIAASLTLADFVADGIDVAVRHGLGQWPGVHSELLFTVALFPVCSPAFVAKHPAVRVPADLTGDMLLHDASCDDWGIWFEALGVAGVEARRGIIFSEAPLAIAAAVEGVGVALAPSRLIAGELASGRLVRPFALSVPGNFAYYTVCPVHRAAEPAIAALRQFLAAEAERDGPGPIG